MSKSRFACLIIVQFILLGCVPEEPEVKLQPSTKLDLYSYEKVIIQHSKKRLSPGNEKAFERFKASYGYYSVFAVNIAENVATWSDQHSLQEAEKQSLDVCKLKSRNKNGCIVYASIIPKGYSPKNGTLTLSQDATETFKGEFKYRLSSNNYGAVAINYTGGFGWATRETKKLAIEAAIENCDKAGKGTMDYASKTWKKYLKPHHFKCKTVYAD